MPGRNSDSARLEAVREHLEAARSAMTERVTALAARPERGSAQGFGKRIGDGTIEAVSRLTTIGVGTTLERTLARTERALEKLSEGTYGVCDACGAEIAGERLEARPDSVACVACAARERRAPPPRR